jgi:uncharacterized protein (DUF58 family)
MKPGITLLAASLGALTLGVAGFFVPFLFDVWRIYLALLSFAILADALFLLFCTARFGVEREISSSLALGVVSPVKLVFTPLSAKPLPAKTQIFDLYDDSMRCTAFPSTLSRETLLHGACFAYDVTPEERGVWQFNAVQLLYSSGLRFWQLKVTHECKSSGKTYPDFQKLAGLAAEDLRGIYETTGLKNIRKRGQGLEFMSLREYQIGDAVKAIDWRATSRRQRVIIREYQEEQDQQVLFLLDSGYRLHRQEDNYIQFDTALNAALLLSYITLKHGDSVAAGIFGAEERWMPPRKGLSAVTALMNAFYDVKSAPVPSSPASALETALSRLNRRTFIVLISNFRSEDEEALSWILPRIKRRHLLCLVSLREIEAEGLRRSSPVNLEDAVEKAAAFSYLAARRALYKKWEHSGLLTLETTSAQISSALINRYLDVKRSGRL